MVKPRDDKEDTIMCTSYSSNTSMNIDIRLDEIETNDMKMS